VFHKSITDAATLDGYQELSTDHRQIVAARVAKSLDEIDEDDIPINPDDLVRKAWDTPKEPPAHLLMPLLPYQKEGLGWMSNQEKNSVHGGILADEMGMGRNH
jgi:DNA repair protein RAD16